VRRGVRAVKFFPAAPAGGPAVLAALAAVFGDLRFCPTGGVSEATAPDYLKVPAVPCVGGSWLATSGLLANRDWARVEFLAKRAAALRASPER
jgi:2-dehydro-3-deoxyphosphogluconate aldolase/(4S)-4-hydroxy-2-oxoglutarate aldolase